MLPIHPPSPSLPLRLQSPLISYRGWLKIFKGSPGRFAPRCSRVTQCRSRRGPVLGQHWNAMLVSRYDPTGCWRPGPKGEGNLSPRAWVSRGLELLEAIFGGELELREIAETRAAETKMRLRERVVEVAKLKKALEEAKNEISVMRVESSEL